MTHSLFRRCAAAFLLSGFFLVAAPAQGAQPALRPVGLRCEYLSNPVGVEVPQLSWMFEARARNTRQSAYRVLVAASPARLRANQGDLWDSGVVRSGQSVHVAYGGAPLVSRQRCFWKVRVWDDAGVESGWSNQASWEMGLLRAEDWRAVWIGGGPEREPRPPEGFFKSVKDLTALGETVRVDGRSTLLRKTFVAAKALRGARVYVSGLGYYELYCNGRRVGDHVLAPAKTNYRRWVLYDTYDLTDFLLRGPNVLGLSLGNGWFNPYQKWWDPYRMQWFGSKRALLQLRLDYADGTSEVVVSDGSWKTAPGPVLSSCVYDGEVYDATQEQAGWDRPGFHDAGWDAAHEVESPGGKLVSHLMPAIRITQQIKPVSLTNPKPGVYIYDLGQNFAGWARLSATGARGTRITLRYAEDLNPDGSLDTRSNEKAAATDVYVMKGEGREVYEPHFTFHGFQYVEVTGFPGVPKRGDLVGCVVHSACDRIGSFECGNELINRIHRATLWSQRSNLMGYPMDCPQRDERLGWLGDAMVTAEEAMFNFDTALFYRHWLDGLRYNQNPANGDISIVSPRPYVTDEPDPTWSSAYLAVVWQYYLHYGDQGFLAEHLDSMRRYVDYLGTQATNHILPKYWIGDWGTMVTGWQEGDPPLIGTAFYYEDAVILAQASRVLGKPDMAARYDTLARQIKDAFNHSFYSESKQHYEPGSQLSNALPISFGLADPSSEAGILENILADLGRHDGHFNVGVVGAKHLIDALTRLARADVAYQLATRRGYPSWDYMLAGRNTLSEFWDLRGSHNHVMMGSIDAWFYRTLAGIQPDADHPGFEHVRIEPFVPDSLSFVRASVQTVRGRVSVEWTQTKARLGLRVSIPANTTATVRVPAGPDQRVRCTPASDLAGRRGDAAFYQVGSGEYEFRVDRSQ